MRAPGRSRGQLGQPFSIGVGFANYRRTPRTLNGQFNIWVAGPPDIDRVVLLQYHVIGKKIGHLNKGGLCAANQVKSCYKHAPFKKRRNWHNLMIFSYVSKIIYYLLFLFILFKKFNNRLTILPSELGFKEGFQFIGNYLVL